MIAPTIEILADKSALIDRAYDLTVSLVKEAVASSDRATLALSGGSTPKPLYEALAKADLPWEKVYIFWGDERYVPHDHPKSNALMAKEAWLNRVPIPAENIFPMPTSAGDPAADAAQYEKQLKEFFQLAEGELPALDFVLQGMGDDGHTASLFPHTDALDVRDRLVTVGNHDGEPRITFTVPLINQGRHVVFLVSGENKQTALAHVFSDEADGHTYPSKLIQPAAGAHWLLDAPAGKGIPDDMK
ncbi:6-phosphogluconolactonase [cf. Phormidesmis sp. LEGE 11477]|uniref:6-phosphogluconolactonase n=1 Tax=cf. Phormidesmis sp. LEGE 11477 TaxID=1828680 RepID=UPI001D136298|nr:6-phosphogluconolactonase [cf. Phormidesmis sp. LEGE 11477]